MPATPVYGREDDDFAYEDEHIEMESDNQEHDDLDEGEFDSRPVLIRSEARSPDSPIKADPTREPKPAITEPVRTPQTSLPVIPPSQPVSSALGQGRKKVAGLSKRPVKAESGPGSVSKRASNSPVKKGKRPPQKDTANPRKKTAASPTKRTAGRKAAPPKQSFSPRKKTAAKAAGKSKRSVVARAKRRRA